MNFSKSLLFPINQIVLNIVYSALPFKLERQSFTYLGINTINTIITRSYKDLYGHNIKRLLERTKLDLVKRGSLAVSLAGRVNAVKMSVLPRFLYLFQMIPLFLPKSMFRELDTIKKSPSGNA